MIRREETGWGAAVKEFQKVRFVRRVLLITTVLSFSPELKNPSHCVAHLYSSQTDKCTLFICSDVQEHYERTVAVS